MEYYYQKLIKGLILAIKVGKVPLIKQKKVRFSDDSSKIGH